MSDVNSANRQWKAALLVIQQPIALQLLTVPSSSTLPTTQLPNVMLKCLTVLPAPAKAYAHLANLGTFCKTINV